MPRKTIALIISLFVVTIILFAAALKSQPKSLPKTVVVPTVIPVAQTVVELSPNPVFLSASNAGTIDVMVDTSTNELTAIQLEIQYDPKAVTNVQMKASDLFAAAIPLLNVVDSKTGRITLALGISPTQTAVKGKGKVAEITFSKLPGTLLQQTEFVLLPKTLATVSGEDKSVIKEVRGTTVRFTPQTP